MTRQKEKYWAVLQLLQETVRDSLSAENRESRRELVLESTSPGPVCVRTGNDQIAPRCSEIGVILKVAADPAMSSLEG